MNKKKVVRPIYVDEGIWEKVKKLADKKGVSTNSMVRRGLILVLKDKSEF